MIECAPGWHEISMHAAYAVNVHDDLRRRGIECHLEDEIESDGFRTLHLEKRGRDLAMKFITYYFQQCRRHRDIRRPR